MAEKILKGINFPGLEDTYLVDNYVKTINGNAPDAEGNIEIEIGSGGSIAAVQSDWNQNDETNAAFIKNRPFYDSEIEVFNQELTFINGENTWHLNVVLEDLSDNTLVEGKNYTVIWDNTSYNCECYMLEDVPCLGNAGNAGHENLENGLPFFIARYNTEAMKVWAITLPEKDPSLNPESTIIYCKIKSDDVHKIDPKYIYQSDWNVIDENDAAYIKNKPFGKTVEIIKSIDWDGNTEGLTNVAEVYYKVSDGIFTDEQIKTCTIQFDGSSIIVSQEWPAIETMGWVTEDAVFFEAAIFIRRPTVFLNVAFNEPGVYFVNDSGVYVTSVTFSKPVEINTVKKIEPKYLYQPDWNQTDETDPTYIKNKPFGETADGVKQLDNKYLSFIDITVDEIVPSGNMEFNYHLDGDKVIWKSSTNTLSAEGLQKLVERYEANNNININIDGHMYNIPISAGDVNDNGRYMGLWIGDANLEEYPFYFIAIVDESEEKVVYNYEIWLAEDKPKSNRINIFPEQDVSMDKFNSGYNSYQATLTPPPFELEIDKEYTIIWDGVEYLVTAVDASSGIPNSVVVGNVLGNGEPFIILYCAGYTTENNIQFNPYIGIMSLLDEAPATHKVAVYKDKVTMAEISIYTDSKEAIKQEYLPSDIGGSVNPDTLKFKSIILESSTEGSSKCFKITIDDTGTLSVEELGG